MVSLSILAGGGGMDHSSGHTALACGARDTAARADLTSRNCSPMEASARFILTLNCSYHPIRPILIDIFHSILWVVYLDPPVTPTGPASVFRRRIQAADSHSLVCRKRWYCLVYLMVAIPQVSHGLSEDD